MEGFIGMAQAPDNMVDLFEDLWEESILPYLTPKQKRQQTFEQALEFMINKFSSILKGSHYQERLNLRPEVKSNSKAQCLRDAGNRCFYLTQQNQLAKALTLYNESIAYAEKGSEDRALAYANRASVCLQFRRYEDCLVNVRLARESNYPSRHAEKLNKREEIAKNGLAKKNTNDGTVAPDEDCATRNDRKKAVERLKLSYNAHANVPQVAECLQLRHDTTFGRHVVTNRALKAGDVVMIEKPFLSVLDSNLHYIRCAYCHDERAFTLIPCEGCTTAMYCSEQCLSNAHQQFHRYECGALRDLSQNGCETLRSLGLRATAVAITTFGHDLDALKTHLEGLDESKVNAFTMDWNTATQKDIYNTVHVLSTNQENRNRKFLARDIFQCTIMHQLMLERTELGAICQADSKKARLIFDLILRHRMICHANLLAMWGTPVMNESDNNSPPLLLGFGYFPLMSMLNHSCVPNVHCVTLSDGRAVLVTLNPIAAGEQLFVSYLPIPGMKLTFRKTFLDMGYTFCCRCDACELQIENIAEHVDDVRFLQRIQRIKPASKRLKVLVAYMNEHERRYSSYRQTYLQVVYMNWFRDLFASSTLIGKLLIREQPYLSY